MRCLACNRRLTEFEATRRSTLSGEFVDLCDGCFSHIRGTFDVDEREDLKTYQEAGDEYILGDDEDEHS